MKITEKQISANKKRRGHYCNQDVKDLAKCYRENTEPSREYSEDVKELARLLNDAYFYMGDNNVHRLSERIREGYIGKEIYSMDGTKYLQTERDKPRGTFVAIPYGDKEVAVGISYLDKDEKFSFPIIGQYLALKDAIAKSNGKVGNHLKSVDSAQYEHIKLRALAYFYPDEFSYSRGKNPIEYKDYKKIHDNRKRLGL